LMLSKMPEGPGAVISVISRLDRCKCNTAYNSASLTLHTLSHQVTLCAAARGEVMGLREDIQRKIERKQAELLEQERNFDLQRAGALAYIQALQDMLKVIPRE